MLWRGRLQDTAHGRSGGFGRTVYELVFELAGLLAFASLAFDRLLSPTSAHSRDSRRAWRAGSDAGVHESGGSAQTFGISHGRFWQVASGWLARVCAYRARVRRVLRSYRRLYRLFHLFVWGQEVPWHDLWRGTEEVWENGEYFTHIITRECKRFLRAQEDGPFFLYVPYNAPHYPMHAPAEYFERFEDLPTVRRHQAAMVAAADDSVGEIMAELDALGLRDDTVVFFQSDNGPSVEKRNFMSMEDEDYYYGGSTGGLRGYKASLFEGGIRMPAWLSWPGRIPAGQTVDEIGLAMDIVPTFLKMAGAEPPEGSIVSPKSNVQLKNDERSATGGTSCTLPDNALERRLEIDGKDILPMAQGKTPSPHEDVFWAYKNQRAVRRGKWKLTLNADIDFRRTCPDRVFLADLESDPGETINLASEHPALTRELKIAIMDWESSVDLSRAV